MNVLVLGFDHVVQKPISAGDDPQLRARKEEYEKLVAGLIKKHDIQFIGEEEFPGKATIVSKLSSSQGVRWAAVEMPMAEREAKGIPQKRPYRDDFDDEGKLTRTYQRVPSDTTREEYMFRETMRQAGNVERILVLCGTDHVGELARRFAEAGCQVSNRRFR